MTLEEKVESIYSFVMDLNSRLLNVETEMKGEMREEIQSLNFNLRNETIATKLDNF